MANHNLEPLYTPDRIACYATLVDIHKTDGLIREQDPRSVICLESTRNDRIPSKPSFDETSCDEGGSPGMREAMFLQEKGCVDPVR